MCMKVKAEVTASDIKYGSQEEGESCAIARTLKREGFKDVEVSASEITGTKMGVAWKYIGKVHNSFIEKFDIDKKKVKPTRFFFSFEPVEVVSKEENNAPELE